MTTDTPVAFARFRALIGPEASALTDAQLTAIARLVPLIARALIVETQAPAPTLDLDLGVDTDPSDTVLITEDWLADVATNGIGWSTRQFKLLGVWPATNGWKRRIIGTRIPRATADLVRALKGHRSKDQKRAVREAREAEHRRRLGLRDDVAYRASA